MIIDLPQAVNAAGNNNAASMLQRDADNITTYFSRFAPALASTQFGKEIWSLYERGALHEDVALTGHVAADTRIADVAGVLREISDVRAEHEARLRSPGAIGGAIRDAPPHLVMALKSTIFKAELSIADIDRGYYRDHALTIARHPSETDERMMVRLLAFALHADDALEFGRGLSTEDEPDLWRRDLTGAVEQWIEVGLPEEREVRKACGRAREVHVLAYGGRAVDLWWQGAREKLERQDRLAVSEVPIEASRALARLAARSHAVAGHDPGRARLRRR